MSIEDEETGLSNEFEWRETYFILFKANNRPTLTQVERAIGSLSDRLQLQNLRANDEGRFESVMVRDQQPRRKRRVHGCQGQRKRHGEMKERGHRDQPVGKAHARKVSRGGVEREG